MIRVAFFRVHAVTALAAISFGCDATAASAPPVESPATAGAGFGGQAASGATGGGSSGAGGASPTGSGGASATGGSAPVPAGDYGFTATNVSVADATRAFERFKREYVEDCGNGQARVISNGQETVSEGVAYGMLLAAGHGDQALFDALFGYYQAHLDENGLMHWKVNGCTNEIWGQNAATDADLDAAMALVQAECRWSGYAAEAAALLDKIAEHETMNASGMLILLPGDVWGGAGCINPSYFAPGYYRVFAGFHPQRASLYSQLADDSYTILERAAHPTTGLLPDWTDIDGAPGGSSDGCPQSDQYGYDAARVPWRLATDFAWWGSPRAEALLVQQTDFVTSSGGIDQVGDRYSLDGNRLSTNHNSTFVGAFALGAMAHSQERADVFMGEFLSITDDNAYFQETLRAVYLLLATGLFTPGC